MPRRPGGTRLISRPSRRISPSVGFITPDIMFIVVVLPQPEGPRSATNSLSLILRWSRSTAVSAPNFLVSPMSAIAAMSDPDRRHPRANRHSEVPVQQEEQLLHEPRTGRRGKRRQ